MRPPTLNQRRREGIKRILGENGMHVANEVMNESNGKKRILTQFNLFYVVIHREVKIVLLLLPDNTSKDPNNLLLKVGDSVTVLRTFNESDGVLKSYS